MAGLLLSIHTQEGSGLTASLQDPRHQPSLLQIKEGGSHSLASWRRLSWPRPPKRSCTRAAPLPSHREARGRAEASRLPGESSCSVGTSPGWMRTEGTGERPGLLPGQAGAGPGQAGAGPGLAAWRAQESSLAVLQKLNLELAHGPSHSWVHTPES